MRSFIHAAVINVDNHSHQSLKWPTDGDDDDGMTVGGIKKRMSHNNINS